MNSDTATPAFDSGTGVGVVLPNDNRQRVPDSAAPPYCWVGQIATSWPDGSTTVGTGVLFGLRHVLTCAHNFINRGDRTTARSAVFTMGLNRTGTGAVLPGVPVGLASFQAPQQYRNAGGPPPPPGGIPASEITHYLYDIAVARITPMTVPDIPGESHFVLGPIPGNPIPAELTGYSGDLDPTASTQYTRTGPATLIDNEDLLTYSMSTYHGDSGAPVYYPDANRPLLRIIGIHVSGVAGTLNFAVPITPPQIDLIDEMIEDVDSGRGYPLH